MVGSVSQNQLFKSLQITFKFQLSIKQSICTSTISFRIEFGKLNANGDKVQTKSLMRLLAFIVKMRNRSRSLRFLYVRII